jgi:hypothetical protein
MSTHPHVNQAARDVIEDLGLSRDGVCAGTGEHAQHQDEGTAA